MVNPDVDTSFEKMSKICFARAIPVIAGKQSEKSKQQQPTENQKNTKYRNIS